MLMTLAPLRNALENTVLSLRHPPALIQQLVGEIAKELLAYSQYIREPQFRAIHPRDLELLFSFYDKRFFCRASTAGIGGSKSHVPAGAADDTGWWHNDENTESTQRASEL